MRHCNRIPTQLRRSSVLAVCLALVLVSGLSAAKRSGERVVPGIPVEPSGTSVEMFAAMDDGTLDVTMIPQNSLKGNLMLNNTTDEPLTVQLPEAFVGVQVLKQYGGGGFGGGGLGGAGGGGQAAGGGGGDGGGGGGGGGFFSVPPDKIVRVSYNSVCLEHGKTEPSPRMRYRPIPVAQHSTDPVLNELLKLVASGRIDPQVAQAAAWNIANDMSWQELASKPKSRLGGRSKPYFSGIELTRARNLVAVAAANARKNAEKQDEEPVEESTQRRSF